MYGRPVDQDGQGAAPRRRFGASRNRMRASHGPRPQAGGGGGGGYVRGATQEFARGLERAHGRPEPRNSWVDDGRAGNGDFDFSDRHDDNYGRLEHYDQHGSRYNTHSTARYDPRREEDSRPGGPPKYASVRPSGQSIMQPGSSIMMSVNNEKAVLERHRMPPSKDMDFINRIKTSSSARRVTGPSSASSLEAASAPAPIRRLDNASSSSPIGSSGWKNTRVQSKRASAPRVALASTQKRMALNHSSVLTQPSVDTKATRSATIDNVATRHSTRLSTSRLYLTGPNATTQESPAPFTLRASIPAKRKRNPEGSAAQPIALDSDSETDDQSTAATNDSTIESRKQTATEWVNSVPALNMEEIEKYSAAKIYSCDVMIGLFQCMADLYFQNDRVYIHKIRGKHEAWPFKPYYMLHYENLQDVRIYRVAKETDVDTPMDNVKLDQVGQLMDEASFLALKCLLPDEADRHVMRNFYDPTDSDFSKSFIIVRPLEDAIGDTEVDKLEDILRSHADVRPIGDRAEGKEYLEALLKEPFSLRSRRRSLRLKHGSDDGEESESNSDGEDSDDNVMMLTYPLPPCTSDVVTIFHKDVSRLKPKRYLNDNIIDYYFKRLMLKDFRANQLVQDKVLFLSSHFYSRLRAGKGPNQTSRLEAGYKNVSTWLARTNFFSRSLIFIPINKDLHWSLAVILNPRLAAMESDDENAACSCIAVLDPLGSYHRKAAIVRNLRRFLRLEWENSDGKTSGGGEYDSESVMSINVKAPRQENGYDCGVYVLKFAEVMIKNCLALALLAQGGGVISREVTDANLEALISFDAFSSEDIAATRKQIRRYLDEDTSEYERLVEEKQVQPQLKKVKIAASAASTTNV